MLLYSPDIKQPRYTLGIHWVFTGLVGCVFFADKTLVIVSFIVKLITINHAEISYE